MSNMKYKKLGKSGLNVSAISFGTIFLGGVQYKVTAYPVTKEEGLACLKKAIDQSIRLYTELT